MVPWLMWSLERYWKINEKSEKSGKPTKKSGKYKIFDYRLRNGSMVDVEPGGALENQRKE